MSIHSKDVPITILAIFDFSSPTNSIKLKYCKVSTTMEKINTNIEVGTTGKSKKDLTKQ